MRERKKTNLSINAYRGDEDKFGEHLFAHFEGGLHQDETRHPKREAVGPVDEGHQIRRSMLQALLVPRPVQQFRWLVTEIKKC